MQSVRPGDKLPTPLLKWAGGKRWLVQSDNEFIPASFNRYFEPFIGSGAVFFSMLATNAILADINPDLTNLYLALKDDWGKVESALKVHSKNHSDEYYYKIRASRPRTSHTRGARLLYLNRTCWNGLYRVNLKGEFNVPRGTKNSVILDTDDFESVARHLEDCKILCQDFEKTISTASKNDFIFIDPPYTVKHNFNGFVKYNEKIFSWDDQIRLRDAILEAADKGVKITMTNADCSSIHDLYGNSCKMEKLERASVIAGSSRHRGATTEIIMRFGWKAGK